MQVSRYGVSATKLRSQGCALQLVLLPFGEDKESMDEYALYKGEKCGKRCGLKVWIGSVGRTHPTRPVCAWTCVGGQGEMLVQGAS